MCPFYTVYIMSCWNISGKSPFSFTPSDPSAFVREALHPSYFISDVLSRCADLLSHIGRASVEQMLADQRRRFTLT